MTSKVKWMTSLQVLTEKSSMIILHNYFQINQIKRWIILKHPKDTISKWLKEILRTIQRTTVVIVAAC
jgi:hypothetical protein